MEEVGGDDDLAAMISALRCWQAMQVAEDEMTRAALYRAAVKYALKARRNAICAMICGRTDVGASAGATHARKAAR